MPHPTTINYGDTNTITGEGHQVAIGVYGSVTQISGPPPVDPAALATAAQQLLELLDVEDDVRDQFRDDAEDVLDAAAAAEPNQDRLQTRGRSRRGRHSTPHRAAYWPSIPPAATSSFGGGTGSRRLDSAIPAARTASAMV